MTSMDGADNTAQDVNGSDASAGQQTDVKSPDTGASPDQALGVKQESPSAPEGSDGNRKTLTLKESIDTALDKMTKPKVEEKSEAKAEQKSEAEGDQVKTGDTDSAESDNPDKDVPQEIHNQPWFKKLLAERKQARQERDQVRREVEEFKHDATQFRTIQNFLNESNVDPRDAAQALQLTRLAYDNPKEFYNQLIGMTKEWGERLGVTLPPDLQKKVDEGFVDLETAKELAKTRSDAEIEKTANERLLEQRQAEQQRAEMSQRQTMIQSWAEQVSKTDPDLKKVMPYVADRVVRMKDQMGAPRTQQEAWDRLNKAYTEVKTELRTFMPPKPAIPSGQQPSQMMRSTVATPGNFQDALSMAIDKAMSGTKT